MVRWVQWSNSLEQISLSSLRSQSHRVSQSQSWTSNPLARTNVRKFTFTPCDDDDDLRRLSLQSPTGVAGAAREARRGTALAAMGERARQARSALGDGRHRRHPSTALGTAPASSAKPCNWWSGAALSLRRKFSTKERTAATTATATATATARADSWQYRNRKPEDPCPTDDDQVRDSL